MAKKPEIHTWTDAAKVFCGSMLLFVSAFLIISLSVVFIFWDWREFPLIAVRIGITICVLTSLWVTFTIWMETKE